MKKQTVIRDTQALHYTLCLKEYKTAVHVNRTVIIFSCFEPHEQFVTDSTSKSEKAMAPHSSTLAWKIPWTEEPGRLQSMGWLGVGHD